MKHLILAIALATSITISTPSRAGIPVVDYMGLIQAIVDWALLIEDEVNQIEQIANQIKQWDQMIKEFESMTGDRGMSILLNTVLEESGRRYMPENWDKAMNLINTGSSDPAAKAAREAKAAGQRYTGQQLFGDDANLIELYEKASAKIYTHIGIASTTYNRSNDRLETIEGLMEEIGNADDPKHIAELQARIATEQALLQSEQIQLDATRALSDTEKREDAFNRRATDVRMSSTELPELK